MYCKPSRLFRRFVGVFLLIPCVHDSGLVAEDEQPSTILNWQRLPDLPDKHGFAGPFTGVHKDALIVAGGANFPDGVPWRQQADGKKSLKRYHDSVFVLVRDDESGTSMRLPNGDTRDGAKFRWIEAKTKLPQPIGYGVSIPTEYGLICIGGEWHKHEPLGTSEVNTTLFRSNRVFVLIWDPESEDIQIREKWMNRDDDAQAVQTMPSLPLATTAACGAMVGDSIYIAGGDTGEGGSDNFWRLDLNKCKSDDWHWERLPSWNGPPRTHAIAVAQAGQFFLISGRNKLDGQGFQILTDGWRFDPAQFDHERQRSGLEFGDYRGLASYANGWTKIADIAPSGEEPRCVMAGTGAKIGHDFIFIFGGARGEVLIQKEQVLPQMIQAAKEARDESLAAELTETANAMYDDHAGFSRDILAYHVTTDTWTKRGQLPVGSPVTTTAVPWGDRIVIPTGEKSPGVRTRNVWSVELTKSSRRFGVLNWLVLGGYLAVLVLMGFYFSRRQKADKDFFLAGGRVPWWAAGLSIFATMLSAITYLSIPATSYGTNWSRVIINLGIPCVAVLVVFFYLPFFRQIKVASAYEYLERRFGVSLRIFGSISFVLFQLGRMGIVVLLPALALSAVTGINVYLCIVAMGILSTIYTVLGGIEAVIWTDVVQVVVLVGGAIAALLIISAEIDGGFAEIVQSAANAGKLNLVTNTHAHDLSWAKDGILVLLLAAFFNNLLPYTSDQAILQRYLTVSSDRAARRAIWTNAIMTIPATFLFFFVGSALWVYYGSHPASLVPLEKPDQIFPWFIATEMPAGIAGLVIAGVFAAAMSSLDSSMHSSATAITTDFYERLAGARSHEAILRFAKRVTCILGLVGTCSALFIARLMVEDAKFSFLFEVYLKIVGLFLGTLGGLFTLGIFSARAQTASAWLGTIAGTCVLAYCVFRTDMNGLLNGAVAMSTCVVVGIITSWLLPGRGSKELSIHSLFFNTDDG